MEGRPSGTLATIMPSTLIIFCTKGIPEVNPMTKKTIPIKIPRPEMKRTNLLISLKKEKDDLIRRNIEVEEVYLCKVVSVDLVSLAISAILPIKVRGPVRITAP